MALQVPSPAETQLKTLKIESTSLIPSVLPSIGIGDVLNVTVRQNSPQGQGLIYFKGLLVKAQLPPNVGPGDKLTAKVMEEGDQIQLKIVELKKGVPEAGFVETTPKLATDLEEILKSTGSNSLKGLTAFQLSETLKGITAFQGKLQSLLSAIKSNDTLGNAKAALDQLLSASNGDLAPPLRETAVALRNFIEQNAEPESTRQLRFLKQELARLFQTVSEDNTVAAHDLDELFETFDRDAKVLKGFDVPEQEEVKRTLNNLRNARHGKGGGAPSTEVLKAELQAAFEKLDRLTPEATRLDPKTAQEITQLATRLDQMATTQEALARLNPVMQALGEPALILFPFLIQGLITHSEVTIESRQLKKKNPREDRDVLDENTEERGKTSGTFQRLQVSVPLPSIGIVDVDVAHRPREILVRLHVADKEVGEFITEQLEGLAAELRRHGFSRTELVSHVGEKRETGAVWNTELRLPTTIVA